MTFRVKKPLTWEGVRYEPGDIVEINEGHSRLRVLVEQSRHLEYANIPMPDEPQGVKVGTENREQIVTVQPDEPEIEEVATAQTPSPAVNILT